MKPSQFDWLSALYENPRAHVKRSEYSMLSGEEDFGDDAPRTYLDDSEVRDERHVESDEAELRRADNRARHFDIYGY